MWMYGSLSPYIKQVPAELAHEMPHEATSFTLTTIHLWITGAYVLIQLWISSVKLLFTNKNLLEIPKYILTNGMSKGVRKIIGIPHSRKTHFWKSIKIQTGKLVHCKSFRYKGNFYVTFHRHVLQKTTILRKNPPHETNSCWHSLRQESSTSIKTTNHMTEQSGNLCCSHCEHVHLTPQHSSSQVQPRDVINHSKSEEIAIFMIRSSIS